MAIDPSLTGEDAAAHRGKAGSEVRSMQDVPRGTSREDVARRHADADVHRLGVESVERWKNLLDRLSR